MSELSDAYLEKPLTPMLELNVRVININLPEGHELLEKCRPLYEYSWFIQQYRNHLAEGMSRDEAMAQTIRDCEEQGIMADFVREHGTEAVNMIFTQFNMDDALKYNYEEGVEDGVEIGKEIGVALGKELSVIRLICSKLKKGKSLETIAEALEVTPEFVEKVQTIAQSCDYDAEKIYRMINTQ